MSFGNPEKITVNCASLYTVLIEVHEVHDHKNVIISLASPRGQRKFTQQKPFTR